jgi:ABC-type lipoprotein export system ATPase subunit
VAKSYRKGSLDVAALRGVSLRVSRGGLLAVQGPSGCGKTTLLNMVGLLDEPTQQAFDSAVAHGFPNDGWDGQIRGWDDRRVYNALAGR